MAIGEVKEFLLWSTVVNYGVIFVWFGLFVHAHDWMYRMHSRWFQIGVETFDGAHYLGISLYKIAVLLLNLVPLLVICIAF